MYVLYQTKYKVSISFVIFSDVSSHLLPSVSAPDAFPCLRIVKYFLYSFLYFQIFRIHFRLRGLIRSWALFPFPPTSLKYEFYGLTSGFTRLIMKTKYVCYGLISLHVKFHDNRTKWTVASSIKFGLFFLPPPTCNFLHLKLVFTLSDYHKNWRAD